MAKRKPGWKTGAVASLLLVALPAAAAQLKSATYFALQRGMTESELLVRAGPPDLVTHPGGQVITHRSAVGAVAGDDRRLGLIGGYARTRYIEIKEYHYIPDHTEHDPHLTVVTLRAGRIFEIERTKLLTRPAAPPDTAGEVSQPRPSDEELRIEQIDRVLSAAEAYAATRARLKGDKETADDAEADDTADRSPGLYTGTSTDGVRYFGDRPLQE